MKPDIDDATALVALVVEDIESMGHDLRNVRVNVSGRRTTGRLGTAWPQEERITVYWPIHEGDLDYFEDTVRHEVAHVLARRENNAYKHDATWKRWARALGAHPRASQTREMVLAFHNQKGTQRWDDQ